MSLQNPCMQCGACCALFPVAFDSCEADNTPEGVVPILLTIKKNTTRSFMRGTEKNPIRCHALEGNIGQCVKCTIYDRRPTPCRKFIAVWEGNGVNNLCDQARSIYGLTPLSQF